MQASLKRTGGRLALALLLGLALVGVWGLGVSLANNRPTPVSPHTASPVGSLYAWGSNTFGQVGDGTTTQRNTPVTVDTSSLPAGLTFTAVAGGTYHSLALGNDGKLYAWGGNGFGQLGDGTTITRTTPVAVNTSGLPAGLTFTAIDAGSYYSVALGNDGKVYTWGSNTFGQLGDGTTTSHITPLAVSMANLPAGVTFTAVAAGDGHILAVGSNGKLYAWGHNSQYQVGDGTFSNRTSPVAVNVGALPAGITFSAVAAGSIHSVALSSDGRLYAWGYNTNGQVGDGTTTNRLTPVTVTVSSLPAGLTFSSIAAGNSHNLALGNDGKVYAWGLNNFGQLGDNTTTQRNAPVAVDMSALPAGVSFASVAAGNGHSLAQDTTGRLYAWGLNSEGQVGDGTTTNRFAPVTVSLPAGAIPIAIAGGGAFSLAVLPLPTVSINSVRQAEGNSGTSTPVTFTVSLSYATSQTVTVQYATADGTATVADNDYQSISGTLTLAPGLTTTTLSVLVNGDNTYEPDETFTLNLSNPGSAILGANSVATGTILNDDPLPAVSTANVSRTEGNSGTTAFNFPVVLTNPSSQTVTVGYTTADNTATAADNDYVPISGTLTLAPGQITATLTVQVNGDTKVEPDETFTLNLTNPVGATLGAPSVGVGTIINDDTPCNPLLVTTAGDDGSCGTLRAALDFASVNPTKTITINLAAGTTISLTTGLTLTNGVTIMTTAPCGVGAGNTMLPPITIQGAGASSGDGLTLAGNNRLYGLWVRGFSGVQIKAPPGSSTKMQCVKASKL